MHQIYLFQSTSHLGMKGPQSEFPMKVLTDALKRGMSMQFYTVSVFGDLLSVWILYEGFQRALGWSSHSSYQSLSVSLDFDRRFSTNKSAVAEKI